MNANPEAEQIAQQLARIEADDGRSTELDRLLASVTSDEVLWEIAGRVPLSIAIAGAVYRRSQAIGASSETARGYLALAHLFEGDVESAAGLIGDKMPATADPVLLDAWTALADGPAKRVTRLKQALELAPESMRLWRELASEALRSGDLQDARKAHEWLSVHESNPRELQRVRTILRQYGWQGRS